MKEKNTLMNKQNLCTEKIIQELKQNTEDISKLLKEDKKETKVVCFIDIMGMKDRMYTQSPDEMALIYAISKMVVDNPCVQEDGLIISAFSDCMYIVADKENIHHIFDFLAVLACHLLNKYTSTGPSKNIYDCIKLRGGITYGDVSVLNQRPNGNSNIPNIITGVAAVEAYILESKEAQYPRIIVDEKILELLEKENLSKNDFCLVQDYNDDKGYHYFDFLKYLYEKDGHLDIELQKCIDFVTNELNEARNTIVCKNKLIKQLSWYKGYLEEHIVQKNTEDR